MSTKASILWAEYPPTEVRPWIHIFHDCNDEGPIQPVYIETSNGDVGLTVAQLRDLTRAVLSQVEHARTLANESDEEIVSRVRLSEAETTAYHKKWVDGGSVRGTAGALLARDGDVPESTRIDRGVSQAKRYRETCRQAIADWDAPPVKEAQ